ncbi:MAG TPA: selenobiotic family radical SAM modification target peptide [Candidatus Omnitrophica bacterium]|nr:selenobiotic family radical SAM modification target peptide [Candidatus Omnitrophota bacterium]
MDKKIIKKTLAGLGIATLVASMTLTTSGCGNEKPKGSCGAGSCGKSTDEGTSSCGKGSCGK